MNTKGMSWEEIVAFRKTPEYEAQEQARAEQYFEVLESTNDDETVFWNPLSELWEKKPKTIIPPCQHCRSIHWVRIDMVEYPQSWNPTTKKWEDNDRQGVGIKWECGQCNIEVEPEDRLTETLNDFFEETGDC